MLYRYKIFRENIFLIIYRSKTSMKFYNPTCVKEQSLRSNFFIRILFSVNFMIAKDSEFILINFISIYITKKVIENQD